MRDFAFAWIFFSLLFFVPLADTFSGWLLPNSLVWNDFGWLLFIFILGMFFWQKVSPKHILVRFGFLISLVFIVNTFFYSGSIVSLMRYLVFTWLVVPLLYLRRSFSPLLLSLVLLGVLCLQAQWGIGQFMAQHDLGFYVLGESHLSSSQVGIAKFLLGDTKLIRAYGPYQHANLFGTISALGVLLSVLVYFLTFRDRDARLYFLSLSFIFFLGLLLSFSRGAYLVLTVGMFAFFLHFQRKILATVPLQGFGKIFFLIFLITTLVFVPLFLARSSDPEDQAYSARLRGYGFARGIIYSQPSLLWQGIGIGKYIPTLESYLKTQSLAHEIWEEEPVHNSFLLLIFELGYPLFLALGIILLVFFWKLPLLARKTTTIFVLALLPVALLDHFLVTQTSVSVISLTALFFLASLPKPLD